MSPAPTRIQLCGRLEVEIEGQRIEGSLPGRQGRLLLAYLALNRDRPVRRDELVEALWAGNGQPASADSLLRPPLSRLRKALGPGRVEGRGELSLVLPEGAWIDWEAARDGLAEARAALAAGKTSAAFERAREVVEIAERGLLPGLEADWIDERRRELEELRVEALETVAVAGASLGDNEAGIAERAARAAIEAAPFRESAHVALMEALAAAGNVAEAMRAFDDLRTMLREELGTAPGPRVLALHDRLLRAQDEPPPAWPPDTARLAARNGDAQIVERDDELMRLAGLLDEAASGHGRFALIEGPAGIGKTRLLAEGRRRASAGGIRVLSARGSELEREFPFGVVRQLLEAVVADPAERERALAGAAAPAVSVFEAGEAAGGDTSFAALHGLFWLCVNLSADAPLLLAVDDLHWVDRPSLRFLGYLTQRLEGLPILVAGTLRTGEPPTDPVLVAEIVEDPATASIRPRPLTEAAVGELVRERLGADADDAFCAACHRATVGNPLLLRQLLSALEADSVQPVAANCGVVRDIGQGAVSRSVLLRLARLGPEATAVARAVAVLGEHAELPSIAAMAELDEQGVADAAAALARAEILRPERPPGFVHPLIRDAVYHDLPLPQRELRHSRAARILADAGAPLEQVASHLLLVPHRGDPWVSDVLQAAAGQAVQRGAGDSAVALLERALAEPPPPERRGYALLQLGTAEWLSSGPAAAQHLQEGYDLLTDPVERAYAAEGLGRALLFTTEPLAGLEIARGALAALPPGNDDLRDRLDAFILVAAAFGVGDPLDARRLWPLDPPAVDEPGGRKMLAAISALNRVYAGEPAHVCSTYARAALAGGQLIELDNGLLSLAATATLVLVDDPAAEQALAQQTSDAHRRGSLFSVSSLHLWSGFAHLWRGELREAESMLRAALSSFDLFGYGQHAILYRSAFLAWTLLERGDLEGAREELDIGHDLGTHADGQRYWLEVSAQLLVEEGRYKEAIAVTDVLAERFPYCVSPPAARFRVSRAAALEALGRRDEALAVAREELALAQHCAAPTALGRALRLMGSIEGDAGISHLWEAVDVLAQTGSRLEHARALAALGTQLGRSGRPHEAREHLESALQAAVVLGAGGLVESARAELRAIGVEPRVEAPTGVRALTENERRIAALAAEGRSERDIAQAMFVTPNAVEVQMDFVFRKLGIESHDELAPALARG